MLTILTGDAIEQLRTLPDESVQCCVTSPPYWGLRDYSTNGQLGLEKTPEEYVAKMVEVFREVRRVLRKDGTLWLNLGDSYCGTGSKGEWTDPKYANGRNGQKVALNNKIEGLKQKDLVGIPWRVAFALQADGWWLRSDIIWAKPNPMPESVTDRPTKSHEYLFLLTKSANYFYDAESIREPHAAPERQGQTNTGWDHGMRPNRESDRKWSRTEDGNPNGEHVLAYNPAGRNKRSVWTVATAPYPEAHFATYPPDLIKPCIMAGTSAKGCCAKCGAPWERIIEDSEEYAQFKKSETERKGGGMRSSELETMGLTRGTSNKSVSADKQTLGWQPTCKCDADIQPCTVLDPFAGSGTTGMVALELGRKAILIELNPKYVELIRQRCDITPGLQLA